jgi:hypothetical protein
MLAGEWQECSPLPFLSGLLNKFTMDDLSRNINTVMIDLGIWVAQEAFTSFRS